MPHPLRSRPRGLIPLLSEEHAFLRRGLLLLARYAQHVRNGGHHDPLLARKFVRFFRDFGDLRHHAREEEVLFPWLAERGLPLESGPLAVLNAEHELGRDLRLALSLAAGELGDGPRASPAARERFHELALRYVELLSTHIEKEELVLFPLAERLAGQDGPGCEDEDEVPAHEREWIAALERQARAWPRVTLGSQDNGTPYGFERLCEESLR